MKIYHHIYSIYYIRQAILYLKSQASAFALFTASTESGKVGFGIRWRTLPIWIRSHSAEYKADLIPASTNWILEMQNRLYIMQICKFVKEKYYANILIYSIKSNVQKIGLTIFYAYLSNIWIFEVISPNRNWFERVDGRRLLFEYSSLCFDGPLTNAFLKCESLKIKTRKLINRFFSIKDFDQVLTSSYNKSISIFKLKLQKQICHFSSWRKNIVCWNLV